MRYLNNLKKALVLSFLMFVICGLIYPLLMTGISQIILPKQANGSLLNLDGKIVGSELIGQEFTDSKLFHSRPSAVNYNVYEKKSEFNGLASGSNNFSVSNPVLRKRISNDIDKFLKDNPTVKIEEIPEDIVTASGSGLDPHISLKAAQLQVDRIADNTGLSKEIITNLIKQNTSSKIWGIFGEETVNVLKLNIDLLKEIEK